MGRWPASCRPDCLAVLLLIWVAFATPASSALSSPLLRMHDLGVKQCDYSYTINGTGYRAIAWLVACQDSDHTQLHLSGALYVTNARCVLMSVTKEALL
jgi:hypothetical protein